MVSGCLYIGNLGFANCGRLRREYGAAYDGLRPFSINVGSE